mmetsp:Transcript_1998/g.3060  ORF Transcript_1998/g.3060 Transcript_1998/m.3060 type:complete len:458 (+) Transcript_1998:109-1482(+)
MTKTSYAKLGSNSLFQNKKIGSVGEMSKNPMKNFDPLLNRRVNNDTRKTPVSHEIRDALTYSKFLPAHSPKKTGVMSFIPTTLRNNRIASCPEHVLTEDSSYESGSDHSLSVKLSPTSLLKDVHNLVMRTSEQDPSAHQIEMPKAEEFLRNVKLCTLLDMYHSFDDNFDFKTLIGIPNLSLKKFLSYGKTTAETRELQDKHRPIVEKLLENGEGITVEGYAKGNAEAVVFDVPSRSKILVVFRGNDEQQSKPVKKALHYVAPSPFLQEEKVAIHPSFKQTYFELESMFLPMVEQLTEENPFAQVVFCGNSFGAGLATLAGVRYASHRPTVRVTVHAFGSPKVGSIEFRHLANSLSNLRIFRLEMKRDSMMDSPQDGHNKWAHVGHSISIGKKLAAYRFDFNKPATSKNIFKKKKGDSEAYRALLEKYVARNEWIESYSGEDIGDGVRGSGNEKRGMV